MSNPKDILDEALKNIRDDRVASNQLLFDLSQEIASGETDLARSGMVAANRFTLHHSDVTTFCSIFAWSGGIHHAYQHGRRLFHPFGVGRLG